MYGKLGQQWGKVGSSLTGVEVVLVRGDLHSRVTGKLCEKQPSLAGNILEVKGWMASDV